MNQHELKKAFFLLYIQVSGVLESPFYIHIIRLYEQLNRFVNHSFKQFFIRDVEDSYGGGHQTKDSFHILSLMIISMQYKGNQLVDKKMKASLAFLVCPQNKKEVVLDCPTQGWTVDEACLLGNVIYIL